MRTIIHVIIAVTRVVISVNNQLRVHHAPDVSLMKDVTMLFCYYTLVYLVFIPHMEGAVDPAVVIKNLFIFIFSIHISQYMIITLLETPELV